MRENCVRCGTITPHNKETNVTLREHYVDGVGQLCVHCYETVYIKEDTKRSKNSAKFLTE